MSVQIKIIRKGCFDPEGKRIPVGTVLTLASEPKGWANKYEMVGDTTPAPDQELVAAEDPDQEDGEEAEYDPLEPLRQRYRELTGNDPDKRWGYPKLTTEIADLEEAEDD